MADTRFDKSLEVLALVWAETMKQLTAANEENARLRDILSDDATALDNLRPYLAWELKRFTEPFEGGKVMDPIYECRVLRPDDTWSEEGFGSTAELAVERALAKLVGEGG